MRRAFCVVLLLSGKALACLPGEDCWPYTIGFTGYVIEDTPLNTQPGCEPLTFETSQWYGENGEVIFGSGWLGGFVQPEWIVNTTRTEVYGSDDEDGSAAIFDYDYWITPTSGDAILGSMKLTPDSNRISFIIGDCSYSLINTPYAISGLQTIGDSNLDGTFDSGDLVTAFIAGKYEMEDAAGWMEGDWTNDRRFDSNDFVFALTHGAYGDSAVAAVPEPSTLWLLVTGFLLQHCFRRHTNAAVQNGV